MQICMKHSKQIMDKYMPLIKANAKKFSRFEYEETIDESKMMLIDAIGDYDPARGSFGTHLKNKLRYHYLDEAKKPKVESLDTRDETGTPLVESLVDGYDFEKEIVKKEGYKSLYEAIEKLNPVDREIIKMKYWDEMANKEIGARVGKSPKTVANRISLALGVLREELMGGK